MSFWLCVLWFSVGAATCYLVERIMSNIYEAGFAEGSSKSEDDGKEAK